MMRPRPVSTALICLAAGGVLLSACGSSGDGGTPSTTSASVPATSSAPATAVGTTAAGSTSAAPASAAASAAGGGGSVATACKQQMSYTEASLDFETGVSTADQAKATSAIQTFEKVVAGLKAAAPADLLPDVQKLDDALTSALSDAEASWDVTKFSPLIGALSPIKESVDTWLLDNCS